MSEPRIASQRQLKLRRIKLYLMLLCKQITKLHCDGAFRLLVCAEACEDASQPHSLLQPGSMQLCLSGWSRQSCRTALQVQWDSAAGTARKFHLRPDCELDILCCQSQEAA